MSPRDAGGPRPLLPAAAEISVGTMQAECDGMVAALENWRKCPNLDEDEIETVDAWLEVVHISLAAGAKAKPDDKAQQAIAVNCRKGTDSVTAALERCSNGRRPKL